MLSTVHTTNTRDENPYRHRDFNPQSSNKAAADLNLKPQVQRNIHYLNNLASVW